MKIEICSVKELERDKIKVYENLLIIKINKKIYCIQRYCTHRFADLSEGIINEKTKTVRCPLHFSVFNLENGEVVVGVAKEKLKTYKTIVENGKVFVLV